jgi:poly(3-hydroxybutyrate) depolymerase
MSNPPRHLHSITLDSGITCQYVLTGMRQDAEAPPSGWPVVLVYHGGSETVIAKADPSPPKKPPENILDYSLLGCLQAVVIAIQGQDSHNGRCWMNAFPWLCQSSERALPRDDADLTKRVLAQVARKLPLDMSRIYATGKSDGAGMAVFLAAHPELIDFKIRALGLVSGAYFGVEKTYGWQSFMLPAVVDRYRHIVVPPAAAALPVLAMHGTSDPIMAYTGNSYDGTQPTAKKPDSLYLDQMKNSFWSKKRFPEGQAFTASIEDYWAAWPQAAGAKETTDFHVFTSSNAGTCYVQDCAAPGAPPIFFIKVMDGGHHWFGHQGELPDRQIDATKLIADFFEIPLIGYEFSLSVPTPKLPPSLRGGFGREE